MACRAARALYEQARRHGARRLVDARAVWKAIAPAVGKVGLAAVATAAGTSRWWLRRVRDGHTKHIRATTAERLLNATEARPPGGRLTSSRETRRRLQNLLAEGYSLQAISARSGLSEAHLKAIGPRVRIDTARRIAALHLHMIGTTPDR